MRVQVLQRACEREGDLQALGHRQRAARAQVALEGARCVKWDRHLACLFCGILLRRRRQAGSLSHVGIVRQFHQIIEVTSGVVPADVQDIDVPFVLARDRLELPNAGKLTFVRLVLVERMTIDDFDGPVLTQYVPGEPHFSVAAAADSPEEFVVGNRRRSAGVRAEWTNRFGPDWTQVRGGCLI